MMQGAGRAAAALAKVGKPQPLPLPAEAGLAPMRAAKQASLSPLVVEAPASLSGGVQQLVEGAPEGGRYPAAAARPAQTAHG
eukprot:6315659-Pyramimonas_sp.AAC.1